MLQVPFSAASTPPGAYLEFPDRDLVGCLREAFFDKIGSASVVSVFIFEESNLVVLGET